MVVDLSVERTEFLGARAGKDVGVSAERYAGRNETLC
jgi:hypothetical protein